MKYGYIRRYQNVLAVAWPPAMFLPPVLYAQAQGGWPHPVPSIAGGFGLIIALMFFLYSIRALFRIKFGDAVEWDSRCVNCGYQLDCSVSDPLRCAECGQSYESNDPGAAWQEGLRTSSLDDWFGRRGAKRQIAGAIYLLGVMALSWMIARYLLVPA